MRSQDKKKPSIGLRRVITESPPQISDAERYRKAFEEARKHVKVTTFERYSLIQCDDGAEAVIYRHDLVKPILELLMVTLGDDGFYTYEYKITNDKSALEAINSIHIMPVSRFNKRVPGFYSHKGIQPGESETFSVKSPDAPGQVQVMVANYDIIKEGEYLEKVRPTPSIQRIWQCRSPDSFVETPLIQVTSLGPALAPPEATLESEKPIH